MASCDNNIAFPYAATLNPQGVGEVLVWYLKKGYVYVESTPIVPPYQLPGGPDDDEDVGDPEDAATVAAQTGFCPTEGPFGSCLAITATTFKNLTYAFAVRDHDKQVCMVSPVYFPLGSAVATGLGVASCITKEKPVVFYIGRGKCNVPAIYRFNPLDPEKIVPVLDCTPAKNSHLCTAIMGPKDPPQPALFFQAQSKSDVGKLAIFQAMGLHGPAVELDHIVSLPSGTTPLSACQFGDYTVLFFLDGNNQITATKCKSGRWYPAYNIRDSGSSTIRADPNSGLAVVGGKKADRIVVAYKARREVKEEQPFTLQEVFAVPPAE